jgi:hypothetical protein
MISYENMEHFGIKIASFVNFCEAISPKTHIKIHYEKETIWKIGYLLSMMRN